MSACAAASALTDAGSDRSAAATSAPSSLASDSSTSARRPDSTSFAPAPASARAIAWPRPPLAPVTSAVRPAMFMTRTLPRSP